MGGLRGRLAHLLAEAPDDARAVDFDDRWHHWALFRSVAARLDDLLTSQGVGAAARVGLVIENGPEHVAALVGLIAQGYCVVTLSPLQPPERLAGAIEGSSLPAVLASPGVLQDEKVREAITASGVILRLEPDGAVTELGGGVSGSANSANPGVMIEMFTSGTTGPPKRIELTDRQVDRAIRTAVAPPADGRLFRGSVGLVVAPLAHIGGLWSVLSPLYAGRSIAMLPKFSVEPWARLVAKHRPRAAGLVPAALRAVLDADLPRDRIQSLEVVTCGTAYCPPELASAFFDKYGVRVLMTYGATEFAGAVARWTKPMHQRWWERKKGSVGRATRGVELRVVGHGGDEVPAGHEGVLEIRTAQAPQGGDAWVRTSDRAMIDEDGFLFINGRTDDIIVRGGFKVRPLVIQQALERHPAVREAAVLPLPDPRLGQVPVAAVEVGGNGERPTSDGLKTLCRETLTAYEVPVFVAVLDELPRTASAKVSRVDLLERITAEIGSGSAGGAVTGRNDGVKDSDAMKDEQGKVKP